ncbi:nickel-responsive transcriptional regulator NikR [Anaerobaca lacustris]|uniref:Putative nickel-responsive regulator n=1 Tax=Anaerobaca lacustris TaxID=3044600 RepID=A0AAW6TYU0_9BACT|nr:nickel-responsive transcriptional regulator NikR [Sedimentisphaerales bacterium M17dextr]
MADLERIGISLDKDLLSQFDALIARQGYQSRSEAVRDLVRQQLSRERIADPQAEAVAAVFLVYDHHAANLTEKLIAVQHSHLLHAISSLHVHLDEHDCLEIIVLRGQVAEINRVGENILSMKGVKLGRVNLVAV